MKKISLFLLCFGLTACDNNSMNGVCYIEKEISGTTWTEAYVCSCFNNSENVNNIENPEFKLPIERSRVASQTCYKECTKMCNEEIKNRNAKTEYKAVI